MQSFCGSATHHQSLQSSWFFDCSSLKKKQSEKDPPFKQLAFSSATIEQMMDICKQEARALRDRALTVERRALVWRPVIRVSDPLGSSGAAV
jgi:hypothetical protein